MASSILAPEITPRNTPDATNIVAIDNAFAELPL